MDVGPKDHLTASVLRVRPRSIYETQHHAHGRLKQFVKSGGLDPDAAELDVVADQRPARALVRMTAGADLLVVGSRGRGGFARLLLVSVSQQCAQHAQCPVMIVRAMPAGSY